MYKHGGIHYEQPNCIDFSANINPFGLPERVKAAAIRGIEDAIYYPDSLGTELRKALSQREGIGEEQILLGNGAADLIYQICQCVRPENALVIAPGFQEYEQALESVSCKCHYYDLTEERNFHISVEDLIGCIPGMNLVFLCNPHNPTGELLDRTDIVKVLQACEEANAFLVLDECFLDFTAGESMVMYLCGNVDSNHNKNHNRNKLIILKAFTKLYAMPGLRLGYCMASSADLLEKMRKVRQPWSVSIPAQYAGIAALQEDAYVRESVAYIQKERVYMQNWMKEHELCEKVYDSSANFLFCKVSEQEENLGEHLLGYGFAIRDCSNYRNLQKGYYRIAVRLHQENQQLLEAWETCIENRRKR